MPTVSTHSVSVALFGTTRSYTFMKKSGDPRAKTLISTVASATSP